MMKLRRPIILKPAAAVAAAAMITFALPACDDNDDLEDAADEIEDAADEAE